jgi:nicotinamidase-related amidase
MQKDFVDGVLGSKEAVAIVPNVAAKVKEYDERGDEIVFTRDTHHDNYLKTQEGRKLPVVHCVEGTPGWEIVPEVLSKRKVSFNDEYQDTGVHYMDKPSFAGFNNITGFANRMRSKYGYGIDTDIEIELIGLCTDICVISNAMLLKSVFPEARIVIDASCCAGVTPESHKTALNAMKAVQIEVINE